ncbi:sigma-70 family RNA polymerase sigma factor [Paenibacillus motobuensis]|uniref:sigma-70 family RNA polymerase sigma factor n=1 Tax=Paenibacillus TaxID=44249 RepID=UPI00203EB0C6|nr:MULTISPECIES: sigma-70 family RNA polymerase sigma factor [Paenibacillus]MCM3041280.1 sigma-70 family RNA polymerase sigma factor [Paenibacillus lutimineralis]MCM3648384.1 sigma-70 family RNA polymerase sigma factor [Paenibacillus motobuensis]
MIENTPQSDEQLIIDAQNGNFEAFRIIVLRYSNALLSVAYSILGDFHEAQDVTQEAFVKCYNSLHTLKDPTRLGSWLYSIAYRTSLDFVKRKKPSLPYNGTIAKAMDDVHSWLDHYVIQESINKALQSLEEKSKTAVVLHYLSDWSMKEISQFLNLSVSAVESRIRRARDTLKRYLADDFEPFFHPYRLGRDFEQMVCEQVLKRMGHFYIPVTDKKQTTDWFICHFHLRINSHGNLLLESGHELYLLECHHLHSPKKMPVLTFSVSNVDELWLELKSSGVNTEPIETNELFGKLFAFYDPDDNKYYAVENK